MITNRLAIDLSGGMIRVLAGAPGGSMQAAEAIAPPGSMTNGGVVQSGTLAALLKDLMARVDGREERALVAVSDALASFRVLSFAKDTTDQKIESSVRAQLPLDGSRMGLQRLDVSANGSERTVYAAAFDRLKVQGLVAAVRQAGVEPGVVELKSLCVARVVPALACVVIDLTVEPVEIFLVDRSLPRLWHTVKADLEAAQVGLQLANGVKSVLGYYARTPGGTDFAPDAPVFLATNGAVPAVIVDSLQASIARPIHALPVPPRVAPDIRHGPYMACLGLLMRRR